MTTKRPVDPVAEAKTALEAIAEQKAAALARKDSLLEQAGDLGFAAYGNGDAKAKARIRELSLAAAAVDTEVSALDAALAEGRRRLAAARRAEAREQMRGKAEAAMAQVSELRQAGAECAEAMATFLAAYDRIHLISDGIRKAGSGCFRWPRDEVFTGAVRRSLMASLAAGHRHLNPIPQTASADQRRSLAETLELFVRELEISLDRELAEPVEEAAD